jgi:hypothetical protein
MLLAAKHQEEAPAPATPPVSEFSGAGSDTGACGSMAGSMAETGCSSVAAETSGAADDFGSGMFNTCAVPSRHNVSSCFRCAGAKETRPNSH